MIDTNTTVAEGRRLAAVWAGLFLAPAAFLANLQLGYLAVPVSCAHGSALSIHLVHGGCLLVALAGAMIAWRNWKAGHGDGSGEPGGSTATTRFLGGLGLAGSGLFALTIVAQWIPSLTLHPCQ